MRDLDSVFARGTRARRTRARRVFVITSVGALAAGIFLVAFVALRSQPSTPQPAGAPRDLRTAVQEGTYATRPLKNTALIRDGFGPAWPNGGSTVFTLKFRNGTYREFQTEDGGAPQLEDAGTYYAIGSTVTLHNNISQVAVLTVRRANDGFRVDTVHSDCECRNERRIAKALYATGAALHPAWTQ